MLDVKYRIQGYRAPKWFLEGKHKVAVAEDVAALERRKAQTGN